jgi:hypothetical protein
VKKILTLIIILLSSENFVLAQDNKSMIDNLKILPYISKQEIKQS